MNPLFPFNGTRHLSETELVQSKEACPLCGAERGKRVAWIQRAPDVALHQCATCHGASVNPMPTDDALAALYEVFYGDPSHGDGDAHVTFGNPDRFGKHLARHFAALLPRDYLEIMDFGGGDGAIAVSVARQLLAQGVDAAAITVVDYENALAPCDDKRISMSRADSLESIGEKDFDIVIASGVVEHVPDPTALVTALLSRLREGGCFYARTPHVLPFIKLTGKRGVKHFFPFPAHLHDLGQRFWEHFFAHQRVDSDCHLIASQPAIVQVSFAQHGPVALLSHLAKAPWYLLGSRYPFVGGWEVVAQKTFQPNGRN